MVKILSLLIAPHPVPTPESAQALFGHQVCRAGLASEPGSLSCLGSSAPPYSPLWLTLRTSHRVLGDSSAWNAAKLVKGCSNKAPSGTTCWPRGQGDSVESVTCIGHFIWLWNPLISSVFPFLLILRVGRFSPKLHYYVVVLIKKETLKKKYHSWGSWHKTSPNFSDLSLHWFSRYCRVEYYVMSVIPALGRLRQEGHECEQTSVV